MPPKNSSDIDALHAKIDFLRERLTVQGGTISTEELIAVLARGVRCQSRDCRFLVFPDRCSFREPFIRFGRCLYYNNQLPLEDVFPAYRDVTPPEAPGE